MAEGLHFEDVNIGDEIPAIGKKISLVQMILFTGVMWMPALFHVSKEFAQRQGFKDAVVHGPLNCSFMVQALTKWMGESGRMKKLSIRYRESAYPDEALTVKGKVVNKATKGSENLVECEVWVEKSDGKQVVSGIGIVSLPSKRG